MQKEIWKDIPNYEGLYQASNLGRIKSLPKYKHYNNGRVDFLKERILILKTHNKYKCVNLYKNKVQKTFGVHRLISMCFIDNPLNKKCINHKNFIKDDNRIENLEWVTHRENNKHFNESKNFTSKYIGVCWNKKSEKWEVGCTIQGIKKYLGLFENELDAKNAYINFLKTIK